MFSQLFNFFKSVNYFFVVSTQLKRQEKFMNKHLSPLIETFRNQNDGSLDSEDFNKIRLYGQAIPAVLGEAFCQLRGGKMTDKERWSITCLGAITGLFDDLFDRKNLSTEYVKHLLEHPTENETSIQNEKLLVRLYTLGLENSDKSEIIKRYALKVYDAQILSLQQENDGLSEDELKKITFEKGGVSMPLYRCGLEGEINESEYNLLYNLGAIGQFENDIFDIYKDLNSKVRTLATTTKEINHLRKIYEDQINTIFRLIDATSFLPNNKLKFKHFTALVVCSGLVCLDMLQKLSKKNGNVFQPEIYERKDLICDMQRTSNILKVLKYAAVYAKK